MYTYENYGVLVPDLILPCNFHFKASSLRHVNDIIGYIVCDKTQSICHLISYIMISHDHYKYWNLRIRRHRLYLMVLLLSGIQQRPWQMTSGT